MQTEKRVITEVITLFYNCLRLIANLPLQLCLAPLTNLRPHCEKLLWVREKTIKVVNTKAKTSKRYDDARYKKMNKNTIACIRKYCANQANCEFNKRCFTEGSYITNYWLCKKLELIRHFPSDRFLILITIAYKYGNAQR